ncbi:MAG: flagellar basal body-associated FliL family protein [Gemmatimonadaceae bacterium]
MTDEINVSAEEAAAASPKAKRSYLTALVIGVGLIGGGGFGTFVGGPMLARRISGQTAGAVTGKDGAAVHSSPGDEAHGKPGPESAVVLFDNLVLNPSGSGGLRFLLVTVGLRLSNSASVATIKASDAEVRDVLLRVFGDRRVEELADIGQRERLKGAIKTAVDSLLSAGTVSGVYFPQFVIQ